ncbi:MAG: ribonuclease M5 [Bacilli bacterium]|nr:ribonuclease M5 [Bacilli bacterium]
MSKINYPAIIVVEGTSDKTLLEGFIDAEIITTNGSDVPYETLQFLKEARKGSEIVVLTDPDSPGKRIRDVLDAEIEGLHHAFIPKRKAIKKNKVGVAESDKETILEALTAIDLSPISKPQGNISYADLLELGLVGEANSSIKREKIGEILHVGHTNGKTLLKRLNMLGITLEELKKAVEE